MTLAMLALLMLTTTTSELVVDLNALKGQTREQLAEIFPGDNFEVEDWNGWESVEIYTDENTGLVSQIVLNLDKPTDEPEVTALLRAEYGLKLPKKYLVTPPAGFRWEKMPGPIRTITYIIKSTRERDRRVTSVVVTYSKD